MENICAIIDVQGFCKNKKFVPREIAVASNHLMSMCFEVDPELSNDELFEDRVTNNYVKHNVHGLGFKPKGNKFINQNEVPKLLRYLYETHKNENATLFGIKNSQLAKILTDNKIPFIELNTPKLERLDEYYGGDYHEEKEGGRCALRKVNYLKKWINDKDMISKFIKSVYSLY
jgi:hypothetical protein